MSRSLGATLLFVLAARGLFGLALPPAREPPLQTDITAIESFSPRLEGSEGERRVVSYVGARLKALGVPFAPFDFSQSDFEHSFSSCIRVDIAGKSPDTIIVAVPFDQPPDAAPGADGALNVALGLDLVSRLRGSTPPVSLTVLFLGAEYGPSDSYPMGSMLFLRDFQPEYRAAVVYLNLHRVPSRVLVRGGGRGIVTPYWLMNRCVDALRGAKVPYLLRGDESQIFRLRQTSERTLIEPYLKAGYPSVGLEGEYGPVDPARAREWLADFPGFFPQFITASAAGIPEDWDRHYLLFQLGDYPLIISERAYLSILVGALALMLLYSLTFRQGIRKYIRTLVRNLPALLPLAGLSFLFLLAGTLVLEGIGAARRFSVLWSYAPLEFLALKVCVALMLYTALYNVFRRFPFPRKGSFYSAAALFILLVDIVVVALFNVSFTYYFLWAYFFIFLSALVRPRLAKILLFLPAPFWGLRSLIEVFTLPSLPFARFLLLSPIWGNLLIAGVSLPFILLVLRLGLLLPGRGFLRRRVREFTFAGLLFAACVGIGAHLAFFTPFTPQNPQPFVATQAIEAGPGNTVIRDTITVTSPAPLGTVTLSDAGGTRELVGRGTSLALPLSPPPRSPVDITQTSSAFLSRRTVALQISMPANPLTVTITLASQNDFILYDCSFPFVREGSRSYRILIGAFAPNPLPLQLTLPADGAFAISLSMEFDLPLIGARISTPGDTRATTRVKVHRSLEVKT